MNDKKQQKFEITELDKKGFKFMSMLTSDDFVFFLDWLNEIRSRMDSLSFTIPSINLTEKLTEKNMKDGSIEGIGVLRNDVELFGTRALIMRAKVAMCDDLVLLLKTLNEKHQQYIKEAANGTEKKEG